MQRQGKRISITIPNDCSLRTLYERVALAEGMNPTAVRCNCAKLLVSEDIYTAFCEHMEKSGWKDYIAETWLKCGPKIRENLTGGEVEVLDGFFIKESEEDEET